jgi:hypothetical protein
MSKTKQEIIMNIKGLIIVPYAYGGNTGVSIQVPKKQLTTYMKNCCVACMSAKQNAGVGNDVMLVTNIDVPEPYASLLTSNGVAIEKCPFDSFNFGSVDKDGKTVNWQLAFYKLCAIEHCVDNFEYDYYSYLDSDVFVQGSYDKIWQDARNNIMLYDVCEPCDGYMVKEMQGFLHTDKCLTHFGGEFFAASRAHALQFVGECKKVYDEMIATQYTTKSGDEFITSIVASRMKMYVKNAGSYIRRYWTGSYRLMCNDYMIGNIVILHMPAEKEQGILKIYDRYISRGGVPAKEKVWKIAHLNNSSLRVKIGVLLRNLGIVK